MRMVSRMFPAGFRSKTFLVVAAAALTVAPAALHAQYDDPPPLAGRLAYVSGDVSVQPSGIDSWGQAYPNLSLGLGDRVYNDYDGRSEIQISSAYIRLGPNTDVTVMDLSPERIELGVASGEVRVSLSTLWPGQSLVINTPNGSVQAFEQAHFRVIVDRDGNDAILSNDATPLHVSGAEGLGMRLSANQTLRLTGVDPVAVDFVPPPSWGDLDAWSSQRDTALQSAVSYRYVSPEVPGAGDLDAYGDWQDGTQYGAIWFPRNVPGDWAPYHYGHWVNQPPWGWTWVEDESWGYAPFHYGRWVSYGGRWGWIPGAPREHPVYSPALVVFSGGIHIGGLSLGVAAWFPLGPGEAYRPPYHCSPQYIDRVNISNIRPAPAVHIQNTYVTNINITNVTYVNRTVGTTAVSQQDFASGRSVHQAVVHLDARQVSEGTVQEAPPARAPAKPTVMAPPRRAVAAPTARPVLINSSGKAVQAVKPSQQVVIPKSALPKTVPKPAVSQAKPGSPAAPPKPAYSEAKPASSEPKPEDKPGLMVKPAPEVKPAAKPAYTEPKPVTPLVKAPTKPADQTKKPPQKDKKTQQDEEKKKDKNDQDDKNEPK